MCRLILITLRSTLAAYAVILATGGLLLKFTEFKTRNFLDSKSEFGNKDYN